MSLFCRRMLLSIYVEIAMFLFLGDIRVLGEQILNIFIAVVVKLFWQF